jgi:cell division protein FtsB
MKLRFLLFASLSCLFALPASAGIKQDIWKMAQEKAKLSREVSTLFRKQKIKDKDLDELKNQASLASFAFSKARKSHPDLKELNKTSDDGLTRMIKAMTSKDAAVTKTARADYVKAEQALAAGSKKIPELVKLQNKAIETNKAVESKKNELLSATPEGKVLVDKISALDKKMEELSKPL